MRFWILFFTRSVCFINLSLLIVYVTSSFMFYLRMNHDSNDVDKSSNVLDLAIVGPKNYNVITQQWKATKSSYLMFSFLMVFVTHVAVLRSNGQM